MPPTFMLWAALGVEEFFSYKSKTWSTGLNTHYACQPRKHYSSVLRIYFLRRPLQTREKAKMLHKQRIVERRSAVK